METCTPGEIQGIVDVNLPEDELVWNKFFWPEADVQARQCLRCLRLEIAIQNVIEDNEEALVTEMLYVEAPEGSGV
jgi:hypothetical protein